MSLIEFMKSRDLEQWVWAGIFCFGVALLMAATFALVWPRRG